MNEGEVHCSGQAVMNHDLSTYHVYLIKDDMIVYYRYIYEGYKQFDSVVTR